VLLRELRQIFEIGVARHRTLRIRGRSEVHRHRALEQSFVERVQIGQETVLARRRQIDRLAAGGECAGRIGRIERVGDQHGGLTGARGDPARRGNGRKKQAFARAVEHEHFRFRIDGARQLEALAEPGGDRLAERLGALVRRITAEVGNVGGQHRRDEIGHGVLRLADREVDRRLAGRDAGDEVGKAHEGRAGIDRRSRGLGRLALGGHGRHGGTQGWGWRPHTGTVRATLRRARLRPD